MTAVAVAVALGGCGSAGNAGAAPAGLRNRAGAACAAAGRSLSKVPTPKLPAQSRSFVEHGIASLGAELSALRTLRAPGAAAVPYRRAVKATAGEVAALQATLRDLKAQDDPVVAFKLLQRTLAPLERAAQAAWRKLGIPACGTG